MNQMTNQQHENSQKQSSDRTGKMAWVRHVEILLKNPTLWFEEVSRGRAAQLPAFLVISMGCLLVYSLLVASYAGNGQWLGAPVKIIAGTFISVLLCYPSLYIFACLSGASINPLQTLSLFTSGMTLSAILMLGFAPVAFVFTFAIQSSFFMGMIHFAAWGISMYFGLRHINIGLLQLSCKNVRLIRIWGAVLIITMLQMSTTLRPILDESEYFLTSEKRFFVEHWTENAAH